MQNTRITILSALFVFGVWMAATWFLEGRIQTLLRPDAIFDRLLYTVVANMLVGILGAAVVLRWAIACGASNPAHSGFGTDRRGIIWVPVGLALGLAFFVLQGAPSRDAVVVLDAYAQVFMVSAAEVVVCWALVAGIFKAVLSKSASTANIIAALVASDLFGLSHFAHSPPFNSLAMVAFPTVIGLVTSIFFLVSKNVYATIAFHNFLGVFGVVRALVSSGNVDGYRTLQIPLLTTAIAALLVLAACDRLIIRRARIRPVQSETPR